ncbi:MAG: Crp/Fnr family transcriptional regulator [Hydrogenophaga sp.]|jgi:CRP-like cAMP-binding protein|nr:Crp/Fnr family transcriptional regulator [Hydrogenophaga sp.]
MTTAVPPFLAVLRIGRWFRQLPSPFAEALVNLGQVRTLQPGEALFLRNGPPCGLYAVLSGSIRIGGHGGSAQATRETLLAVLGPPAWFGEISVFDNAPRTHDAHAHDATTVLQVPHGELQAWLDRHPHHWRDLGLLMADKMRVAFVSLEEQTALTGAQRLARRLLHMARDYSLGMGDHATRRVLAITQEELAHMLGLTRQTTNQLLHDLRERAVVRVSRGEIEILDLDALQAVGR